MAAPASNNPQAGAAETKASKKKKAKGAAADDIDRVISPAPTTHSDPAGDNNGHDNSEHPFVRELQKQIRNINKKLSNMAKTEAIAAANPGKSPDQLLAEKLINADQKAQIEKKPTLSAQVQQLEEQLIQFKKLEEEHKVKVAELEKDSAKKRDKAVADATHELKKKLERRHKRDVRKTLQTITEFLRLAAGQRAHQTDPTTDENSAIEGVLLNIYLGDSAAVDCMAKLAEGSDETTVSIHGEARKTTFARLKDLAYEWCHPVLEEETEAKGETKGEAKDEIKEETKEETKGAATAAAPLTDPTLTNASLTEINAGEDTNLTNGHTEEQPASIPSNGDVSNTTNEAGKKWDTGNEGGDLAASQEEWVSVPRGETGVENAPKVAAAPVADSNTQSWADDQPDNPNEGSAPADPNEGFQSVPGRRGRDNNNNRGSRGGRGRGGFRGDGRNRGRNSGNRGGNGSQRGPRRQEA